MPTKQELENKVQAYQNLVSTITNRANLLSKLGKQYGGERKIYEILGYPLELNYNDYYVRYRRQDIAKAIIKRPINATWRGPLTLIESDDDNETQFEKTWKELNKQLSLKSKFTRLDKLTSIGRFGVLLFGFDDVSNNSDFIKEVNSGKRKIHYLKPFGEGNVTIEQWENDPNNERFGLPKVYQITIGDPSNKGSFDLLVHYTRVMHVTSELLDSDVYGIPQLEAAFNRLMDLEKLIGGSAEMFWKGARPGYQGKVDGEYTMDATTKNDLEEQIDEYENDLRRILVNEGVDLQALAQQVADPKNHVDVQIEMLSAIYGYPKRILTGSERGELASTQDRTTWLEIIQERRDEHAFPNIIKPFVDKCMYYGVLPKSEEYSIEWSDLWAQSDKEKAEVGKTRATALKEYSSNPSSMDVVPENAFYSYFLGFEQNEIEQIKEMKKAAMQEEEEDFEEEDFEGENNGRN